MIEISCKVPSIALLGIALTMSSTLTFAAEHRAKVLYSFTGGNGGSLPQSGLIADANGNLYGTTRSGGKNHGTVFALTGKGEATVLHPFRGKKQGDGDSPIGDLTVDAEGNLYGTTIFGGMYCGGRYRLGCGIVFKLTPGKTEVVLHTFNGADGAYPTAGLIADAEGNFYGTTSGGGSHCDEYDGCGTVFRLTPEGDFTVLYTFNGGGDGAHPAGKLFADAQGNLTGATQWGGTGECGHGCGTIFKLSPDGEETVLHSFAGGTDGAYPNGVIGDAEGNLYGTTANGGGQGNCVGGNCGTVFKLTPDGKEKVLYAFAGGSDGGVPTAGLILDLQGNLYGTTEFGGTDCTGTGYGCGTVFKVGSRGKESVLHRFGGEDGAQPEADLLADAAGNLYGTTAFGSLDCDGTGYGCGTIFKVKN